MLLNWNQTEFLLKGVYLGLLVMIAWFVPEANELASIAFFTVLGLALFLGYGAYQKIKEGYRVQGRWAGFLVFLLLENPGLVYAGLLVGLSFGSMYTFNRRAAPEMPDAFSFENVLPVLGGAALGGIFYGLRNVQDRMKRFWLSLAMIAILVGGAVALFQFKTELFDQRKLSAIGLLLLLGIPGFYLLTFAGMVEETEIEIAAMCAALGVGIWALLASTSIPVAGGLVVLLPVGIFFVYTTRYMLPIRVFKHALRGMSYRHMGQTRLALISLGRALQLAPRNPLARQQMWDIHRDLDFAELKNHPDLIPFLNFGFCLERVSQMLATKPSPPLLRDVGKTLDLIADNQPALLPMVAYWRCVACLHQQQYDDAAKHLLSILQFPQYLTRERQAIHFAAWQLALSGHPEMVRRVGQPLLPMPGQRMDAIAAIETQLSLTPQDPTVWDMKRQFYAELTEREYWSITQPDQIPPHFDFDYVQQLGFALLDNKDQWQRGCELLRISAHGLPSQATNLYMHIAHTHDKHGDRAGLWTNYLTAMTIGRKVGVNNLQPADKEALFVNVKKVGELALKEDKLDIALEAYKFQSMHENAGIETWRMLANLFEKIAERAEQAGKHDERNQNIWQALHCTEHAFTYNSKDADLIARKDRYYYSIEPDDLKNRLESVHKWFDAEYCKNKASAILERAGNDPSSLDWASHLAALAIVAQPGSIAARFSKARIHRVRGELAEMMTVLESIRQNKPEKFANEDESKAWYFTHRILGEMYLDEKPDQAVQCLLEFRKSDEAGADTSYKLGRAYEALGDNRNAAIAYQEVTAYERHPLFYEARDALERVKRAPAQKQGDFV